MAILSSILGKWGILILIGIIPPLIWVWFWLKEDNPENKEPPLLLFLTFISGALFLFIALLSEKVVNNFIKNNLVLVLTFSFIEEISKFLGAYVIALRSKYCDEPIDFPIYLIMSALGFATLENILFLIHPVFVEKDFGLTLVTGNLRFLGAVLLHSVATSIIGLFIGMAYYQAKIIKAIYFLIGFSTAVILHAGFNFYIMREDIDLIRVFAFLWVFTVIVLLLFERVRRIKPKIKAISPKIT